MIRFTALSKSIVLTIGILFSSILMAQIQEPIKWEASVNQLENGEAELIMTAKIDKGWHLYSQYLPNDDGPIATEFSFTPSDKYKLIGKVEEPKPITEYDKNFDMELSFFAKKVQFIQKIKILSGADFTISGESYSMVCNDEMCLPPEAIEHVFKIKGSGETTGSVSSEGENATTSVSDEFLDAVKWEYSSILKDESTGAYEFHFKGEIGEG